MAAPRAARIQAHLPIVNNKGQAAAPFQQAINGALDALQRQITDIANVVAAIKRNFSHTDPTTIFSATENGSTASIAVASHVRVYGDGTTLTVAGGMLTGLACDTFYAVYYDDPTLSSTTPTYHATATIKDAQFVAADGRHFCGVIRTPAAASGITRTGGGAYPAGASMGGEID